MSLSSAFLKLRLAVELLEVRLLESSGRMLGPG
jgi:hypothetical protein